MTTRRYRHGGGRGGLYPQLVESPVFGHSDTHVLLQIADVLASALIYSCACAAYLPPTPGDPHLDPAYCSNPDPTAPLAGFCPGRGSRW
ncbi:MAG: DUF3800 domain-containing protein [Actinomycetia bacterium]|nr:DUF3800 domain-containing protein [Actinomycetes bacterium]